MTPTRVLPPWVPNGFFVETWLEKAIVYRIGFVDAPPQGVLDVDFARQYIYSAPKVTWAQPE